MKRLLLAVRYKLSLLDTDLDRRDALANLLAVPQEPEGN